MLFSFRHKTALKLLPLLLVILVHTPTNASVSIVMDDKAQAAAGLKTMSVASVNHHGEFGAIAKVMGIQPLLALRERYLVAQAELNGAKAKLKQSKQNLLRQQELYRHGITAKRFLQEQEALGSGDQALVDANQVRVMTIVNEARLLWGGLLAEWVLSDGTKQLAGLLSGREHLLQVTLPANKRMASEVKTVFVEPFGYRSKAYPAELISRSTQADNAQQGESYFFRLAGANLRVGMKLSAWIPESTLAQVGVVVPETAVVWYLDQVFVYIKTAKDKFSRRLIKGFTPTSGGYFVTDGITAGEEVVTTGAQMLLSEELRGQIPDED